MNGQRLTGWVVGSAVLMIIGSFGPWVIALGQSVSGTDGTNDGWLVVGVAALGGLLFYRARGRRSGSVWAFLCGAVGVAVTFYDRQNVQHKIDSGGLFVRAIAHVGWGLNLALLASVSMVIAAAVSEAQHRRSGEQESFEPTL
jgi:hypothetical protein